MSRLSGLAVGLALAGWATAADPPETAPPPRSAAEVLQQLRTDVQAAYTKAIAPLIKAQKTEDETDKKKFQAEGNKLYNEFLKYQKEAQGKALALARADLASETGLDAAVFGFPALETPREKQDLVDKLIEQHLADKKLSAVVDLLAYQAQNDPKALAAVETIAAKSPHKTVRAGASFAVAEAFKAKAEPYGKKAPDDADALADRAVALFEKVKTDYGTEIKAGKRTYAEAADVVLYELRNLRVGKAAPDIEGEDVDGAKFKLSDYRGKVVMLDFWGHW